MRGGDGAVLSHSSAAALWGAGRPRSVVEISVPRTSASSSTIRRHYVRHHLGETTRRHGIPTTTLARTLMDLAATWSSPRFEAALRSAEYGHRFDRAELAQILRSHPGQRGAMKIRLALQAVDGGDGGVRSPLEARFAAILARSGLPQPRLNALIDLDGRRIEVDCLWRRQMLVVELDGKRAHRTAAAFEGDRERDRLLQVAGWRVVRITSAQLARPARILRDLAELLG